MIEIRQVQEFADFPADVQEAAAGFPEMQAQSGQRHGGVVTPQSLSAARGLHACGAGRWC